MTELDTLKRAKMYMDKLARGINPVDDTVIPDEDVINNVRMIRCFLYISGVLQNVIDNTDETEPAVQQEKGRRNRKKQSRKKGAAHKSNFVVPENIHSKFQFSSQPIAISEFVKRINSLINKEVMQPISRDTIKNWLANKGLLKAVRMEDGQYEMLPTPKGEENGIILRRKTWEFGKYQVVLYSLEAQELIIENLKEIVEQKDIFLTRQEQWNDKHNEQLAMLFKKDYAIEDICELMERDIPFILKKLKKLDLIP